MSISLVVINIHDFNYKCNISNVHFISGDEYSWVWVQTLEEWSKWPYQEFIEYL